MIDKRIQIRLLLACALFLPSIHIAADQTEEPAADHGPNITLSPAQQTLSGIRSEHPQSAPTQREIPAYGRIVDIQGLLELRTRYRAAHSETLVTEAALGLARKNRQRLASLYRESIIPARDLIQAEAQQSADTARHEAARRKLREIREETIQSWGSELLRHAIEGETPLFKDLLERRQVLVLIALTASQSLPESCGTIEIAPIGTTDHRRPAHKISPAPRADETSQGESWFFATTASQLRTGMRLDAHIPCGEPIAPQVVVIPSSAIVWSDGKPWFYLKTGNDSFTRRLAGEYVEQGLSWRLSHGLTQDDEIVVEGGQLLLSHELRGLIPDEVDD